MARAAPVINVFEDPRLLLLALVLPPLLAGLIGLAHRRRMARLRQLGDRSVVSRLLPSGTTAPPTRRLIMLSLAALLCGIAFAGPRWGRDEARVTGTGIDMVLALDASLSMMANDERPSRLERMKQEVRRLRSSSTGDRIGVIAFAGRSYIMTPLTTDAGALDLFTESLDPSVVGQAGSAVSHAIRQGTDLLLATQSASDRALVIMSDWESFDEEEQVLDAARRAQEAGISVVVVGFGSISGSRIPLEPGGRARFKLDEVGRVVTTRYNPSLMFAVASAAGGVAIDAGETDKAARIRRALSTLRSQRRTLGAGSDLTPRFQLFLVPALILLMLETIASDPRMRTRIAGLTRALRGRRRTAAALTAVLFLPQETPPASQDRAGVMIREKNYVEAAREYRRLVQSGKGTPRNLYNLGTSLLLADSLSSAINTLDDVVKAEDLEVRYRALFNAGLAQLSAGLQLSGARREAALDAALDSYRGALLMRPDDVDAKWNYELALREREGGGGGGGQQQQEQNPQESRGSESEQRQAPSGLGRDQAEQLLDNAARDERDVQARAQDRNRPSRPPGGKDW